MSEQQPTILEPIADGDSDTLLDILIAVARRVLREEQAMVHSEDQAA